MEIVKTKGSVSNYSNGLPSKEKKENKFLKKFKRGKYLFLLVIPTVICMLLFYYLPMWGILIAFKQYSPFKGLAGSPWVGLKHFRTFFENPFFFRYFRNTILLSFYSLIWGFPAPIIFALILNDVQNIRFKKLVQTVSYMPHFYSTVVVVGLFTMFLSPTSGPVNKLIQFFGHKPISFLADAKYFRTIYVASEIWQNLGWGAIIYLAALTNIDPQLYEAAIIDGASKFKRLIYVTLPCLAPTIITMLLLRLGHIMNVGFERAYLLQKPSTYETSDIIQTYIYRTGIESNNFSFASAVGLFNSVINVIFLVGCNKLSQYLTETSLW
ncbi:MAG TPA: sugar ABC transporter permease [Clostridiaceae bacterium]|nr:sugar ABC transporter permease [Clostridiaceae bacterium]